MERIILAIMLLIVLGICLEKIKHPSKDISELVRLLKRDFLELLKALFETTKERHVFDSILVDDLKNVTKEYAKTGFEIRCACMLLRNVPCVGICFVPDHILEDAEIQALMKYTHLKFREYLGYYTLDWKSFISYSLGNDYITLYIFYAEQESDRLPFRNLYRQMVRANSEKEVGILRDKELDKELENVN